MIAPGGGVAAAPLRVLQVGTGWFQADSGGGAERVYTDLFRTLPRLGIELVGAVLGPNDVAVLSGGRVASFADRRAPMINRLLGARETIKRLAANGQFDLVAAHFALYLAPAVDRLRDLPLVVHFHGPWAEESAREGQGRLAVAAKRAVEQAVYRRAARVIVLSRAFAELVTRRYGVAEERIRIVPGSVHRARFDAAPPREEARRLLGWPNDRRILFSVRRLAARMGLDRLIEAMVVVAAACPDVLLLIGGRGPLEGTLRRQVSERGLGEHVRFLGFVPDATLPAAYRAADLNVVPSDALEGFGLTALEAMAAGTPSMVTPVGGLPEVVSGLSPDLVFRSTTAADLAAGLIAALRGEIVLPDPAACRAHVAGPFDEAVCAAATAAVYRELA